jgi:hypothetical protein
MWAAPLLRRLVAGFPPRRPGFKPGFGHVEFCDGQKWRWGRFSPRTSVSPANPHSICFSTIIFTITRGWHNRPEVAAVPIASQTRIKKKKKSLRMKCSSAYFGSCSGASKFTYVRAEFFCTTPRWKNVIRFRLWNVSFFTTALSSLAQWSNQPPIQWVSKVIYWR